MKKLAALVPMRHHSERVPGKNYRPLAGKPLYHYILDTLSACEEIDTIVVDTDSPEIAAGLQTKFPKVQVIDRPEHLRAGDVPMNEVLLHDTALVEADFYLQTHTTNPLLLPETIQGAIHVYLENYPAYDLLFSVTRWQTRLWDSLEGRSIIIRRSYFARRICPRFSKKIPACTSSPAGRWKKSAIASESARICSRSTPPKPGTSTRNWILPSRSS